MGLFGSFFGNDQREDLVAANQKATKALKEGYDKGYGDYTGAIEGFDPYVQSGQQSQKFYDDLLGLNGPEARAAAQQTVTSDPQFTGELNAGNNTMLRYLNARGESGGGKAFLSGQRVLGETYGNWMDRYRTGGAQGLQAATGASSARMGRGDLSYGYGATKAGQAINMGNAMAESRGIGINNLLKLGEVGAKAAAAFA